MTQSDSLTRPLLLVVVAIVLLPVLTMAVMMPMMGMWGWGHVAGGGMWGGTGGGWMWLVMWFVPLLVIVGVGYLVYAGVRRADTEGDDAALEELRIAYARGDLSDEEFEHRRERLRREV